MRMRGVLLRHERRANQSQGVLRGVRQETGVSVSPDRGVEARPLALLHAQLLCVVAVRPDMLAKGAAAARGVRSPTQRRHATATAEKICSRPQVVARG